MLFLKRLLLYQGSWGKSEHISLSVNCCSELVCRQLQSGHLKSCRQKPQQLHDELAKGFSENGLIPSSVRTKSRAFVVLWVVSSPK